MISLPTRLNPISIAIAAACVGLSLTATQVASADNNNARDWPIPEHDFEQLSDVQDWPLTSDFSAIQPQIESLRSEDLHSHLLSRSASQYCPSTTNSAAAMSGTIAPNAVPLEKQIYLFADQVSNDGNNPETWQLRGAVELVQDTLAIRANSMDIYNGSPQKIELEGHIRYISGTATEVELGFQAQRGHLLPETDQGSFETARYLLPKKRVRGTASRVNLINADKKQFHNLTYSTCPVPKDSWQVTSSEMTTNLETGRAEIWNAVVRIKDVPVFYTPYANFPIDGRRLTGFLLPSFGSSKTGGFEFSTPFYWSIAPNYDAVITPTVISERGVHTSAEMRYLFSGHSGTFSTGLLFNDQITNDDRYLVKFIDDSQWDNGWNTSLHYSDISDREYLNDFTTNLASVSTSTLHRYFKATRNIGDWRIAARIDDYKAIDPTLLPIDAPYQVLPRITAARNFRFSESANYLAVTTEVSNFRNNAKVNGSRWLIRPELHFPSRSRWYETDTVVSLDAATYVLNDTTIGGFDSRPTRVIPSLSSFGKLIFESDSLVAGFTQTLEPTVMYLYTPEINQTRTPNFDSGTFERNYAGLFRRNRFTGGDRVGDENRITLGLTTRLLDDEGDQHLRADIGQSFFFEDRGVQLPGVAAANKRRSELAAQITASFDSGIEFSSGLIYDPVLDDIAQATVDFSYRGERDNLLKFRHRFVDNNTNLSEIIGRWKINPRWQFVGRMGYSHRLNQTIETLFGLEYQSCCWAFRVVNRSVQSGIGGQLNESILFEFELKGLSNVGNSIGNLLESRIDRF